MNLTLVVAAFFVFCFSTASALTFTESFTTTTQKNASGTTVVWNSALGILHPTLIVSGVQVAGPPSVNQAVDVGDGSDGPFNNATYANFGTVVGPNITIDANVHPILFLSSFQLDAGMILTSINGPLIIYSLSTVNIDGTIECSGINGLPAVGVLGGNGGAGRCGGQSGGFGGGQAASGGNGDPLVGAVSGGGGGNYGGIAPGAGGGGAGSYSGNPGGPGINSPPNTGGMGGNGAANFEFTDLTGGPGGGGGSGSNTEGGGGGGGGGGTVVIHAVGNVTISATGAIFARGGTGGAANTGGGGGGGAGGGVKILTAGNLHLDSGTPIDATGGNGSTPATGAAGGGGSFGRTWLNYSSFSGLGNEFPGSGLFNLGIIEYVTTLQTAETVTYDTASTLPIFSSITSNPANGDITLEVAGSTDNFATDDSGWLPAASIATLNNRQYIKFRLNLTNSNAATPTVVNDVTITYTLGTPPPGPGPSPTPSPSASPELKENFQFQSGCGRLESGDQPGPFSLSALLLMSLPFLFAIFLKCRRRECLFPNLYRGH